jgi:hypothetical protein
MYVFACTCILYTCNTRIIKNGVKFYNGDATCYSTKMRAAASASGGGCKF